MKTTKSTQTPKSTKAATVPAVKPEQKPVETKAPEATTKKTGPTGPRPTTRPALRDRFLAAAKKAEAAGDLVKYDHLAVIAERCLAADVTPEELKFGRRVCRKVEAGKFVQ